MEYNALLDHHSEEYDPETWWEGDGTDYNDYLVEQALQNM